MSKRIVSFFLCFVMTFSLAVVPSSADYIGTPVTFFDRLLHWGINGADDVSPVLGALGQFSGFIYGTVCTGSDDGYHHADSISGCDSGSDKDGQYAMAMCKYCGESFKVYGADLESAYNNYVTDLENDLGTTILANGGIRKYFTPDTSFYLTSRFEDTGSEFGSDYVIVRGIGSYPDDTVLTGDSVMIRFWGPVTVPFSAYVYTGFEVTGNHYSAAAVSPSKLYSGQVLSAGKSINIATANNSNSTNYACEIYPRYAITTNVLVRGYADFIPIEGTTLPTTQNITINSRPTTLVGDYGIIGDNGTIIHVEGDVIVDESNTTIYNPVTNVTNVFTDWAFDYSTRTYTLTLEDGSTVTVTYGNENITINEGDTIYNVYYVLPSEDDPGADPDDPGTDDGSGWAWWKEAWQSFIDRFFGLFGDSDTDIDQALPGEEDDPTTEEDDGWSILDLFRLLRDALWKVITGILNTALNGFLGLVNAISSIGDFFTVFDRNTEGGVLDILNQGGSAVWE